MCVGGEGCEWQPAVDSGVFLDCFLHYFLRQDLSKNNVGTWFLLQDSVSVHLFISGTVSLSLEINPELSGPFTTSVGWII